MKDDLRYTPSDCFETFPFPFDLPRPLSPASVSTRLVSELEAALDAAGREYYDFRAALMVRNNEGLTKTYNRFHDPDERDPDLLKLRELHDAMDRAVLDAYGWTDIRPSCQFILDYEDDEDETPGERTRRRKPWRYRWPDDVRDEVLARLLALNAKRAEEEELENRRGGADSLSASTRPGRKRRRKARDGPALPGFAGSE